VKQITKGGRRGEHSRRVVDRVPPPPTFKAEAIVDAMRVPPSHRHLALALVRAALRLRLEVAPFTSADYTPEVRAAKAFDRAEAMAAKSFDRAKARLVRWG
jgi:hypothetical protein